MLQVRPEETLCAPFRAVLDTNAVLAMWWFQDPATDPLRLAVEAGKVVCVASAAMRAELVHVLGRLTSSEARPPASGTQRPDAATVVAAFDRWCGLRPAPPPSHGLRCTDGSDQVFIDLAMAEQVQTLFSRDRAVLKLRRRAAAQGLAIRRPDGWAAEVTTGACAAE